MLNIPDITKRAECVMGIDEAGRGPVLGPMVYACAFWPIELSKKYEDIGAKDSKQLKLEEREKILNELLELEEFGYLYKVLEASFLSASMLSKSKYNLNNLSHDTVIDMINLLLKEGVNLKTVYIDTVGDPGKYQSKILSRLIKPVEVVVSKKADSLYPVVSAASIVAKVNRDLLIQPDWGSGYPADPNTVAWLNKSIDPVFGFTDNVRFSWSTCTKLLESNCVPVEWEPKKAKLIPSTSLFSALGFS